jgi:hypothetical protein
MSNIYKIHVKNKCIDQPKYIYSGVVILLYVYDIMIIIIPDLIRVWKEQVILVILWFKGLELPPSILITRDHVYKD